MKISITILSLYLLQEDGHEGSWLCFDTFPKEFTPDNCKMYSFEFNRFDIKIENYVSQDKTFNFILI